MPDMDEFKEHFAVALLGRSRTSPCVGCDTPDLNFRDDLSRKEYGISRFCQTCQDSVFTQDVFTQDVFTQDPNEYDSD